jgi:hypothetical protein
VVFPIHDYNAMENEAIRINYERKRATRQNLLPVQNVEASLANQRGNA